MADGTIQAARELCDDIDNLLELAKQSRASIRAVTLIELAREDLQDSLNELEFDSRQRS